MNLNEPSNYQCVKQLIRTMFKNGSLKLGWDGRKITEYNIKTIRDNVVTVSYTEVETTTDRVFMNSKDVILDMNIVTGIIRNMKLKEVFE